VSVLLSANAGLYGDVIRKTMEMFYDNVSKDGSDVVVIGKVGKSFFESKEHKWNYSYFDFSDDGSDEAVLREILKLISKYRNIVVYHGMFKDILTQVATRSDITKEVLDSNTKNISAAPAKAYIFEPSLEKIVTFFEKEIVGSLFEQYVYESSLSKFSSRMINLDYAIVNISHKLKITKFLSQKFRHKKMNSKQQDVLSGIYLWAN
jgi:F0F1-type ATP synthase gamma subunit